MSAEPINMMAEAIKQDKAYIFADHPRAVMFRWNSKWYNGIRVSTFSDQDVFIEHGYSPDTDTIIKINFDTFKDAATGNGAVAPTKRDRLRMDNVNWRVQESVRENDDLKLFLRKEVSAA